MWNPIHQFNSPNDKMADKRYEINKLKENVIKSLKSKLKLLDFSEKTLYFKTIVSIPVEEDEDIDVEYIETNVEDVDVKESVAEYMSEFFSDLKKAKIDTSMINNYNFKLEKNRSKKQANYVYVISLLDNIGKIEFENIVYFGKGSRLRYIMHFMLPFIMYKLNVKSSKKKDLFIINNLVKKKSFAVSIPFANLDADQSLELESIFLAYSDQFKFNMNINRSSISLDHLSEKQIRDLNIYGLRKVKSEQPKKVIDLKVLEDLYNSKVKPKVDRIGDEKFWCEENVRSLVLTIFRDEVYNGNILPEIKIIVCVQLLLQFLTQIALYSIVYTFKGTLRMIISPLINFFMLAF